MGQLISQPITEKNITSVSHDRVSHVVGEMQGYRMTMEDAYCDNEDVVCMTIRDPAIMAKILQEDVLREQQAASHRNQSSSPQPDLSPVNSAGSRASRASRGSRASRSSFANGLNALRHKSTSPTPRRLPQAGKSHGASHGAAVHTIQSQPLRPQPSIQSVTSQHSGSTTDSQASSPPPMAVSDDVHDAFVVRKVPINIYGVFDGHGGSRTSRYMAEHLPQQLIIRLEEELGKLSDQDKWDLSHGRRVLPLVNFPKVLKDVFLKLDSIYYREPNNQSGSTGVVALMIQNYIIVANTGDSRCVLSVSGGAKSLSFDHKPKDKGELLRIHEDGCYVASNRVNSILALSRAFGDYSFKMFNVKNKHTFAKAHKGEPVSLTPPEEYAVSVEPDIFIRKITRIDEFLIIACDGIWDCYKPQDLVHLIRHELSLGKKLPQINEMVLESCIRMANTITGIGFDNMTLIIVALHQNQADLNQWYSVVKNKVLDEKFGKGAH